MKVSMAVRLGTAIAGLFVAGMAGAQGPGGTQGPGFGGHRPPIERALGAGGGFGRWWNNPKIVETLKLTDEQRKGMDAILLQHREKLIDLRGNVEKAEIEMEPLMHEDQPNEAKILAQIDKVAQSRAELEKANARFLLAIRGKLTPDQWKQVQAFRANHEQQGRGFGDRGHAEDRFGGRGQHQGGPGAQGHPQAPPPPPGPQGMMQDGPDVPASGFAQ